MTQERRKGSLTQGMKTFLATIIDLQAPKNIRLIP
jgi:hypothetical protein